MILYYLQRTFNAYNAWIIAESIDFFEVFYRMLAAFGGNFQAPSYVNFLMQSIWFIMQLKPCEFHRKFHAEQPEYLYKHGINLMLMKSDIKLKEEGV